MTITISIALMITLVSSAFSAGPFLIQSAWALPYVSSVSVSPSSAEKTKGEIATYTVTVTRTSGSGSGTVSLSFQSDTVPSSAAHFEDSGGTTVTSVNFGNGGPNSKSVNLKIDTNDLPVGQHAFTVKGTKSNAASDSATSSSTSLKVNEPPNQAPTADAGSDQAVNEGDSVSLDGSGSSDPDGDGLSYSWVQTVGEEVQLDDSSSETPSFTAPDVSSGGDVLTFELTVDDGNGGTNTDTVDITVENVNGAPTADAGSDQTVNEGESVSLDGSESSDSDGTIESYSWAQIGGENTVELSGADTATPSFNAPSVGAAGDILTFELTVTDNDGATGSDSVDVSVGDLNSAPTADAGSDQTVNEGDTVGLDGSASSDPDGDTLTYTWTQTAGQSITLDDSSSATPSFTAPSVESGGDTLSFELTVDDGNGHTDTDTVDVIVGNTNQMPTADAGSDFSSDEGTVGVQLQGSGSDADGTISSYHWEQVISGSEPTVTLADENSATTIFDAPAVSANTDLTFKLTVTDNDGATDDDTVVVTINNVNQPPIASLTVNPDSIEEGSTSDLDASGSTDDAGIVEYAFEQVGGTAGTITVDSGNPSKATFEAPSISADETVTIKLTVKDTEDATDSTTIEIAVTNAPPHATTLTLNTVVSVPWGKDVTVTGKLTDNVESGAGVGGVTITFDGTGADNVPDVITAADGTFTSKGASPSTISTAWTVQAHFAGDSDYIGSNSVIKKYSTFKHSVLIALSGTTSKPWGMPTSFVATLTDSSASGVTIQGKTIHFDGTGVIGVSDQVTGSDGKATGTGTAPTTVATGWTVQAHFAGDSLYSAKDSSIKSYSTTKHAVTLSISVPSTPVALGASYKVSGTLTDGTLKQPLASKTITFTADPPITISDKTTNTNGFYSATQAAPTTSGTYNIQSHFAGDSLYNAKDSVIKALTVS